MDDQLDPALHRWPSRLDRAFAYYRRLALVRERLERNIEEPLTLGEAAGIAGLNVTYFSSFFHRKTGMCFRTWVSGVRVRHAARLIAGTDDSITEIAFRSGFQDLRTFERAFRREMLMTAREYRKTIRPD